MGISAAEFWQKSQNGKAMLNMLANRTDPQGGRINVELVRDICEWLVITYRADLEQTALAKGASREQAKSYSTNAVEVLKNMAEGIHDRNVAEVSQDIVDKVFKKYWIAGQAKYAEAMLWLANELRRRVADDQPA